MNSEKKEIIFLQGLLTLIIFGHLFIFNKIPLQFDELLMYEIISKFNYLNLLDLLMKVEIQMPFSYWMGKTIFSIFGDSSLMMRLPSLVFVLIIPWAFYKLARFTLPSRDALKAVCLLMMFHPVLLFSGSMRPYLLIVLLALLILIEIKRFFIEKSLDRWSLRRRLFFGVWLILISLTHPVGLAFAVLVQGIIIYNIPKYQKHFYVYAALCLLILVIVVFHRQADIIYVSQKKVDFSQLVKYVKNSSYLSSGGAFSFAVLMLISCFNILLIKKRVSFKQIDSFHLIIFFVPILTGAFLSIIPGNYIYPRHLMLCLPSLAFLLIQVINSITKNKIARNIIFLILILILAHKSFIKEKIHSQPYEIDSLKIAQKSMELSKGVLPIVTCGNCFSYYIKDNNLHCVGRYFTKSLWESNIEEQIFIDTDYSGKFCKERYRGRLFLIDESYRFKGGTVMRLKPIKN